MELASGILIIIISVVHIVYGEKQQISTLNKITEDSILIGSFRVMSFQGGLLLFFVGLVQVLNFLDFITLSGIVVYFPIGIICLNILTFLFVALIKHRKLFSISAFQLVIFTIIITFQILAIIQNN